jgi:replicative DNA helicase
MAAAGYPGAIYEMEMGGVAIVRRQVSALSKIETYKMRQGKISGDEWSALTTAIETVSALPVYISDESHWTTTGVRADLARLKELYGIKWFIADYLDLFEDLQGHDENSRSKHISGQIHAICKDLDLAGLMIHSINKTGMSSSTKSKANLSGSGKHSYDADQVVFITKPNPDVNVVNLTWDKMREGDGDRFCELVKLPGLPAFADKAKPATYGNTKLPDVPF